MTAAAPLHPEWTQWIAENALRGAPRELLVSTLVSQGLDETLAVQSVDDVLASPILDGARTVLRRSAGIEQAARLRRSFEALHPLEVHDLDTDTFFHQAWTAHRPLVFRNGAADWPEWTLEGLRERFGETEIEMLEGRSAHPRWWRRRESLRTPTTLSALLDRMNGPASDDVYAVARNGVLAQMPGLLDDLGTLPGVEPANSHPFLWIGPAGTLTPLHHDQSAAWLVQRIGTKRVWLASPLEPALMDSTDGVFNRVDPRDPVDGDGSEIHWWETVLTPGDAIFLPAGWWHQVLALGPSVSVSMGGFRWSGSREWYSPGRYAPEPGEGSGTLPTEDAR